MEEIKILFVGEKGAGKTSIIKRFEDGTFKENLSPATEIKGSGKIVKFNNGSTIKIISYEKGNLDNLETIKDFQAIVLVYSQDDPLFNYSDLINDSLKPIKENADENAIIALALNKSDILGNKEFNEKEGKSRAKNENVLFFSTSAMKNEGIAELYGGIIRKIKGWDERVKLEGEKNDDEIKQKIEQKTEEKTDKKNNEKVEKKCCWDCFK